MYLFSQILADNRYDPDFEAVLLCMDLTFFKSVKKSSGRIHVHLIKCLSWDRSEIMNWFSPLVSLSVSLKSLNLHVFFFPWLRVIKITLVSPHGWKPEVMGESLHHYYALGHRSQWAWPFMTDCCFCRTLKVNGSFSLLREKHRAGDRTLDTEKRFILNNDRLYCTVQYLI